MSDEQAERGTARWWQAELSRAGESSREWETRGREILRRYAAERAQGVSRRQQRRFALLWSTVQTVGAALFSRTPAAVVERRWKGADPVGRTASLILQRALQYEIDTDAGMYRSVSSAVSDRLLVGRGTVWVRYEPGADGVPSTPVDYVHWTDFRASPDARVWGDVTWVARRVWLSEPDGEARFGEAWQKVAKARDAELGVKRNGNSRRAVWELWDWPSRCVYWLADGCEEFLDQRPDPYGLDGFFPCPMPLYATLTNDTLIPVPDFDQWRDQADEIDLLTNRINAMVTALRVVGVYDASQDGVRRMLSEGAENTLIPVQQWAVLGEKGGIRGVVDFMPLTDVINALQQCYVSRDRAVQAVYEVTGISDIVRGTSRASETATAQRIKEHFVSLRLRVTQRDVALFISETLRLKAGLMASLYDPQYLLNVSGVMQSTDAQYVPDAIALLQAPMLREFRIEVNGDSMVDMDEASERSDRLEFLAAASGFLTQTVPLAQSVPQLAPLLLEMLRFGVRTFRGGRELEGLLEAGTAELQRAAAEPAVGPGAPAEPAVSPDVSARVAGSVEVARLRALADLAEARLRVHADLVAARVHPAVVAEVLGETGVAP